ncbi:MAG: PhzF family phenazine biosynthesis protein [Deltaproteobacteria bacterium]|nr:PhzF family phenazine biosynthesis protein [Deltaproteobacteria bacterium]
MRRIPFVHVDVFTDQPLCGNGLTVFTRAHELSDAEMAALARETRQAETTFVIQPPGSAPTRARVRIFTPAEELPFAGHPTLGTAAVLHTTTTRDEIVLELGVGPIPVRFEPRAGHAFGEMRQNDPVLGEILPAADVARAANLEVADLDPKLPARRSSTGLPFIMVPLRDRSVLKRVRPTPASMEALLARTGAHGLYLVAPGEEAGVHLHARMFDPYAEDPATGSAAGACTGWMLAHGVLAPGARAVIAQGDEIQRPSRIHVRGALDGTRPTDIRVGGSVIEIARGEVTL